MKLNNVGRNQTEIEIGGLRIFYSYRTPVAYYDRGKHFVTDKKYSMTTTRHINQWLAGMPSESVPQSQIDQLLRL